MDKSFILSTLLRQAGGDYKILLGELQFAFIVFFLGENLEGLEQWKQMLNVICCSELCVVERPEMYVGLVPVIYE